MASQGVIIGPRQYRDNMQSLADWIRQNRINNITILDALHELGATEVIDLIDLTEEDISKFQPPFLKKLEYVRFARGIQSLKVSNNEDLEKNGMRTAATIIPVIAEEVIIPSPAYVFNDEHVNHPRPPLPPRCVGGNCSGVLSSRLGTRKNKYLMTLSGPDFRWIVSCSDCTRKWHACHFLCGHLQKISPLGASDIIRHEQGRFNRWQKKIKPPCPKNPKNSVLKATYKEQRKNSNKANGLGQVRDTNPIHTTEQTKRVPIRAGSEFKIDGEPLHSVPDQPNVPSHVNPAHQKIDEEFRTIIGALDEDALNFSGAEEGDRMDEDFEDGCSDHEDNASNEKTHICQNSKKNNEEPANKRVKVTESPEEKEITTDEILDVICDEIRAMPGISRCDKSSKITASDLKELVLMDNSSSN